MTDYKRLPRCSYDTFSKGYFKSFRHCLTTLYKVDKGLYYNKSFIETIYRVSMNNNLVIIRDNTGSYDWCAGSDLPYYALRYKRFNIHTISLGEL